jgi:type I restriction enzyme S subunit
MIRTSNVRDGRIDLTDARCVSKDTFDRWTRRQVPQRGDVILTREAPLGEVGIIRGEENVFLGQRLVAYRVDEKRSTPEFLLYSLMGTDLRAQIAALGSGSTVQHMRVPDAKKLLVNVPSLPVQRRIADILSAYDDLIEVNTRRIAILEEMARRMFTVQFASSAVLGTVGDLAQYINRGIAPHYDDRSDLLVINQKCIRDGKVSLTLARRQSRAVASEKVVRRFDVLVNSTGVGTLGRVAQVFKAPIGVTVDTHVTIVRPRPEVDPYFFGMQLLSLQARFERAGKGSTGQTELSRAAIAEMPIPIPAKNLQDEYGRRAGSMFDLAETMTQQNNNLRAARDLLLPKLISGEIDLSQAEAKLEAAQ